MIKLLFCLGVIGLIYYVIKKDPKEKEVVKEREKLLDALDTIEKEHENLAIKKKLKANLTKLKKKEKQL